MGQVADKIRNTPPKKVEGFLPKGYQSTLLISTQDSLRYQYLELVCQCQMKTTVDYWVGDAPLKPINFTTTIIPRTTFHYLEKYFWLLSAGICEHCQTLYWRIDPLSDDKKDEKCDSQL